METWNRLRRNKVVLFISILLTLACSCKKDQNTPQIDLGYAYFPNQIGRYKEYFVDSTFHGISETTLSFYRREELSQEFLDDEGQVAVRVERFKKINPDDTWILTDVWTQKRTPTTAERFEENQRFVRLAFPINSSQSWDGNAFNTSGEWLHTYSDIGAAKTIGSWSFDSTLTVNQRNNVNLVDQELAYEIYAKNVGLVYKSFKDLNIQNQVITGVEYEMTLTDYGIIQ